jgi:parallel beta-helix repeat protein
MEMKPFIKYGLILVSLIFIYLFISMALTVIPQWLGTPSAFSPTLAGKNIIAGNGTSNITLETPETSAISPLSLGQLENQTVVQGDCFRFTLNGTDLRGRILKYEAESLPPGASLDSGKSTIVWIPSGDQSGLFTINLAARNQSLLACQTLFITVKRWEKSSDPANLTLSNFLDSFSRPVALSRGYPEGVGVENLHIVHPNESIQAAIDKARNGDTVIVQSGVYPENVVVGKRITMWGQGNPVIDGRGSRSPLSITVDGVTVDGFWMRNSGSSLYASGIKISSNRNTIANNSLMDNQYGINLLPGTRGNNLLNNTIFNNSFYAIYIPNSMNTDIHSNTIVNNREGLMIEMSWFLSFTGNTVSYNSGDAVNASLSGASHFDENVVMNNRGYGIALLQGGQNSIRGNIIGKNTGTGIMTSDYLDVSLHGNQIIVTLGDEYLNFISNNTVKGNKGHGVSVSLSNTLIENNEIGSNNYGIFSENSQNLVRNNILKDNSIGIDLLNSGNSTLLQNTLQNNVNGIKVDGQSGDNELIRNTINGNRANGLILLGSTNGNLIKENTITNNKGIGIQDLGNNIIGDNFLLGNTPDLRKY